jgi:hypothetical protein
MKKIHIRDHPEYEFIKDENDFVSLVDTYLGEDAKVYLEDLIKDYKERIDELKDNKDAIEGFKSDLIDYIEDY